MLSNLWNKFIFILVKFVKDYLDSTKILKLRTQNKTVSIQLKLLYNKIWLSILDSLLVQTTREFW